ncbi:ABC transporter ATP-binding protein [Brevibacillus sp. MS2.2]|uniref:ABC transporter ATP-binding protein n=1 Tax=Brevibacillus sp. MS2.2 TaxID=2738981 RepID=UPI00156BCA2B|nr:ABC transporter ATP-binding protein [Brevibacillus sp. MS2.2]NRR24763.1 ABC transporter ATP-binding protein [Brevibacillus sp. MS2.2]
MKRSYFAKTVRLIWAHGKLWLICSIALRIILAFSPLATIWIMKEMVNEVTAIALDQTDDYQPLLWLLAGLFSVTLVTNALETVLRVLDAHTEQRLEYHLEHLVAKKAASVPLSYFDDPEFYNHHHRIRAEAMGERFLDPVERVLDLGKNLITLISYAVFLLSIHWGLAVMSLLAVIPLLIVQIKFGMSEYFLARLQTPEIREASYISSILNERDSSKEVRLFQLKDFLLGRWSRLYLKNMKEVLRLLHRREKALILSGIFTSSMYIGCLGLVVLLLRASALKVGDFVAIAQAVQNTQQLLSLMTFNLAHIVNRCLYIADLFDFLEYEDKTIPRLTGKAEFPSKLQSGITFDRVSFCYPKMERNVINEVSFTINPGERIAIVGDNGSGKTTLVKCLMGLYPIHSGDILFDNQSIRELDISDLQRNITVIFQDFIRYNFTAGENITIGRVTQEINPAQMRQVAVETGADTFIRKLPSGYDTILGRTLQDGEDLSGGQWQKIALARALYRRGEIFILDEPTAALDPQAELEVFQQFDALTQNKTAIFISHRMAAARMADRIFVMKQGQLIEVGHHDELMDANGEYSRMYRMQAKWFA